MTKIEIEKYFYDRRTDYDSLFDWLVITLGPSKSDRLGRWTGGRWAFVQEWRMVSSRSHITIVPREILVPYICFAYDRDAIMFKLKFG
jgi:hypothetical protein